TLSLIFLISSTPLLLAASISITSEFVPRLIPVQITHSLQGPPSERSRQLIASANTFAILVLPVPLGPHIVYADERFPFEFALPNVLVTCSWPTTSSKLWGLNILYKA